MKCEACGKEFEKTGNRQKYCNDCRHEVALIKSAEWKENHKDQIKKYIKNKYEEKKKPKVEPDKFVSHLNEKLKYAAETGLSYAEIQRLKR